MKVIYGLGTVVSQHNTCIAIGIFDGVHRGHQHLIRAMIDTARRSNAISTVITFYPHPAHILRPQTKLPYLASLSDRLKALKQLGVQQCFVVKFNKRFAMMSPEGFIRKQLSLHLKAKAIFVGEDFRFGKDRAGDIFLFEQLSKECGFKFVAFKPVKQAGALISSTRLRGLITEGNLKTAKSLLGRHFSLSGKVIKGEGRGRLLGYPTANVDYEADIIVPKGVYAVRVKVGEKKFDAVANLGVRPSFASTREGLHLEVHLLQATINLYGSFIEVEFIKKIRDEQQFPDMHSLQNQIKKDISKATKILK